MRDKYLGTVSASELAIMTGEIGDMLAGIGVLGKPHLVPIGNMQQGVQTEEHPSKRQRGQRDNSLLDIGG